MGEPSSVAPFWCGPEGSTEEEGNTGSIGRKPPRLCLMDHAVLAIKVVTVQIIRFISLPPVIPVLVRVRVSLRHLLLLLLLLRVPVHGVAERPLLPVVVPLVASKTGPPGPLQDQERRRLVPASHVGLRPRADDVRLRVRGGRGEDEAALAGLAGEGGVRAVAAEGVGQGPGVWVRGKR